MKRKAAREEEDFKNRINPGGVYMAHRDSDGEHILQSGERHLDGCRLYTAPSGIGNK